MDEKLDNCSFFISHHSLPRGTRPRNRQQLDFGTIVKFNDHKQKQRTIRGHPLSLTQTTIKQMGINGLLPELTGCSTQSTKTGFDSLSLLLHDEKSPTDVDVGTLTCICALAHRSTHDDGNYVPDLREFQRRLALLTLSCGWKVNCVFDIELPHEKRHDHVQFINLVCSISIASRLILMCAEECWGCSLIMLLCQTR